MDCKFYHSKLSNYKFGSTGNKVMKKVFLFLSFSMILSPVFAQLNTASLERFNQKWVDEIPNYVDSYPDSLFYGNRILFFRQTPLSIKPGYSGIYLADDNKAGFFASGGSDYGLRGYQLTWIVRNDSLFIHHIYIINPEFYPNGLSEEMLYSRMKQFTGGRFINGLLFVDWITSDLQVISKYCGFGGYDWNIYALGNNRTYTIYNDDRKYGSILTVKNGLVVGFSEDRKNNPPNQSHIIQREWDYDMLKWGHAYYVDSEPDTLLYNGRKFFFRRSPLSQKQGYTDVYHEEEVSIFNITSNGNIQGIKGYHLTWVTRNDSLFISDVYPTYYDPRRPTLSKDTIIARMRVFTGGRFINGLLFVNWISGDFGIITKHNLNFREIIDVEKTNETHERVYKDDRKYGSYLEIKNGLNKGFWEVDVRKIKN